MVLPGSVQAYYEAPIYARTNGYLQAWYTDIGTPVQEGPVAGGDRDPGGRSAAGAGAGGPRDRAGQLRAREHHQRALAGPARDRVGIQAGRRRESGRCGGQARRLQSAAANVARLRELESFKRVLAPFDGVVTQRNTDVGALINAGQTPAASCSVSPIPTACASTCPCRSRTRRRSNPG